MRLLGLLALLLLAGCLREAGTAAEACERVYDPLFDPAGPRVDVEHAVVALAAPDPPPGCRVLADEADIRAALGDAAGARDLAGQRLVTLRASSGQPACFEVREVYGLGERSIVVATQTGSDGCSAAWGVLLAGGDTPVIHAHDER